MSSTITTLTPEFCYLNYCDYYVFGTTITSDFGTGTNEERELHNYDSSETHVTSGFGTDVTRVGTPAEHLVVFDEAKTVTSIKILNHNLEDFTVELYEDGVGYTTVIDTTTCSTSYYNYYESAGSGYLLVTSDGDYLLTTSGLLGVSATQYTRVRLRAYTTQAANQEKYIGELYVGARAFKLSTGKVMPYEASFVDNKLSKTYDYNGAGYVARGTSQFQGALTFSNCSFEEYSFLKDFAKEGGLYTFFPTGTDIGYEMSSEFAYNDIELVTCTTPWKASPWRTGGNELVTVGFMETKYVDSI